MSGSDKQGSAAVGALEIGPLNAAPETVEHRRENVRERLAMTLTGAVILFAAVIVVAFFVFPDRLDKPTTAMTVLFTSLVGIYGVVLRFYFGGKR